MLKILRSFGQNNRKSITGDLYGPFYIDLYLPSYLDFQIPELRILRLSFHRLSIESQPEMLK